MGSTISQGQIALSDQVLLKNLNLLDLPNVGTATTNLGLGAGSSPTFLPVTFSIDTATPNDVVNVVCWGVPSGTGSTNVSLCLKQKGTGAIQTALTDNAITGGNIRGTNAIDLQTTRTNALQVASGSAAAVLGGVNNRASGANSVTAGGAACQAINTNACCLGGYVSVASGSYSCIVGSYTSTASGASMSCVLNSELCTASGSWSLVFGGNLTSATADYAVARGKYALSNRIGGMVQSNGRFAANGDAQSGSLVMRRQTTDATPVELTMDGTTPTGTTITTSNRFILLSGYAVAVKVTVIANQASSANRVMYVRSAVIYRNGATTTLVGLQTLGTDYESNAAWDCTLVADDTNESLQINVTGAAATINWVAFVEFTEVLV